GAQNRFIGIEVSDPMLEAARDRFRGYIKAGIVDIRKMDLRHEYPVEPASVTLSILTLQFTPIEYRHRIVRSIYKHTIPGGAFIMVEKILGDTAELDGLFRDRYYDLKEQNGYGRESIERKKMALE